MVLSLDVNYWAVLVTALASMAAGFLWYSPALFGNMWLKLLGKTKEDMQENCNNHGMAPIIMVAFIGSLLTSFVTANILQFAQAVTFAESLETALMLWLGLLLPVSIGSVLWEGKPVKFFLINAGNLLISLILMSAILVFWV